MKIRQSQKNAGTQWQLVKLGDIGKVSMCKRVLKGQTQPIGDVPFYKIGTFGDIPDAYIPRELYDEYKKKYSYPQKGEILISASGTIGRTVVFNGEKAYFQDSNIVWISNPQDRVLNKFLNYVYLRTKWKSTDGGIISRLYNEDLRSIKFDLPPLPEQNRIVVVLETLDQAIQKLTQKIERKKNIKKGLMQGLLTGKKRLPGFSDKWESTKLGKIASFKKGKGLSKSELNSEGKYEAIHYGELFTKYNEYIENIISRTNSNKNRFLSKKNDILMPTSDVTPRGLSTASYMDKDGVILGGDILVIRSTGSLNGLFFCYLVNLNKKGVIKLVSGSTVFHLYGSDMAKFELKLPPLKEQESIINILVTADKEIQTLEGKLEALREQKRYLLNNLITGTIRTPETLLIKV